LRHSIRIDSLTNNFIRSSIEFNSHSVLEIVGRDRSGADKERKTPAADLLVVKKTRLKSSECKYRDGCTFCT